MGLKEHFRTLTAKKFTRLHVYKLAIMQKSAFINMNTHNNPTFCINQSKSYFLLEYLLINRLGSLISNFDV